MSSLVYTFHEYEGMESILYYLRGSELVRLSIKELEDTGMLAHDASEYACSVTLGEGRFSLESSSPASRSVLDFLLHERSSELPGLVLVMVQAPAGALRLGLGPRVTM